jgi:hypothetical protein
MMAAVAEHRAQRLLAGTVCCAVGAPTLDLNAIEPASARCNVLFLHTVAHACRCLWQHRVVDLASLLVCNDDAFAIDASMRAVTAALPHSQPVVRRNMAAVLALLAPDVDVSLRLSVAQMLWTAASQHALFDAETGALFCELVALSDACFLVDREPERAENVAEPDPLAVDRILWCVRLHASVAAAASAEALFGGRASLAQVAAWLCATDDALLVDALQTALRLQPSLADALLDALVSAVDETVMISLLSSRETGEAFLRLLLGFCKLAPRGFSADAAATLARLSAALRERPQLVPFNCAPLLKRLEQRCGN